jgi:hypothetical protein
MRGWMHFAVSTADCRKYKSQTIAFGKVVRVRRTLKKNDTIPDPSLSCIMVQTRWIRGSISRPNHADFWELPGSRRFCAFLAGGRGYRPVRSNRLQGPKRSCSSSVAGRKIVPWSIIARGSVDRLIGRRSSAACESVQRFACRPGDGLESHCSEAWRCRATGP